MIRLEIVCDLQDSRARGKTPCASRDNANPIGEGRTPDDAMRDARRKATGWKRRVFRSLGMRMGWVCPTCQALADGDNGEKR